MKRFFFAICILVPCIVASCSKPSSEEKPHTQAESPAKNELPTMVVTKADGTQIDIRSLEDSVILVLFQADCDHCQREAEEIKKHIDAFRTYSIYFLSADPMPAIQKFGSDYNLSEQPNVHFAMTTPDNVISNFGPIPAPSMYIYANQRLIRKFNGETDIEMILQVL